MTEAACPRAPREQVTELIALCQHKLDEFKEKRGARIWKHRQSFEGYISGTIRYEVLKQAEFRCELCCISAEDKALDVDHIVPRNNGAATIPAIFKPSVTCETP